MLTVSVAALSTTLRLAAVCCVGVSFPQNTALQMNGRDGRVSLDPAAIGTPASVTVEAWVRLDALDRLQIIVTDASSDFNDGFTLFINPQNHVVFHAAGFLSWFGRAIGTTVLEAGRWYHVAGVYDAQTKTVKVLLDGQEEASVPYSQGILYLSDRGLLIGMQHKTGSRDARFLVGTADEVRIWRVARTAGEIDKARMGELRGEVEDLVGYWPMNEGQGYSTEDASGGDNTGKLDGGVKWTVGDWRPAVDLAIDVRPDDSENVVNIDSHGVIPVALLSTSDFNAVSEVNRGSLTFGHSGDESSLQRRGYGTPNCGIEDVNGDGLDDLVCRFQTDQSGFMEDDVEAVLMGQTMDGMDLVGRDAITVQRSRRATR